MPTDEQTVEPAPLVPTSIVDGSPHHTALIIEALKDSGLELIVEPQYQSLRTVNFSNIMREYNPSTAAPELLEYGEFKTHAKRHRSAKLSPAKKLLLDQRKRNSK